MKRAKRLESLLKNEISLILAQKINDIRIGFISITHIKISKDNKHAYVYYSQIGTEEEKEKNKKGLASATKFIHAELSRIIRYMPVPKLHFRFDDSIEKGTDVLNKLSELNKS